MIISGIYKITDKENKKVYIGMSCDLLNRWNEHLEDAFNPNSTSYNYPLQKAIREKGIINFSFECLETDIYDTNKLFELENKYIKLYNSKNNGYNQISGHQIQENKKRSWSLEEIKLLENLINKGLSYEEIGKRLNRSQKSINTKASRLKLGIRTNNPWTIEKEKEMIKLRNNGISQNEASKILGFSKEAIKKR